MYLFLQLIVVSGCHWMLFVPLTSNPFNLNIERKHKNGKSLILDAQSYTPFMPYALCFMHNKSRAENSSQWEINYETDDRLHSQYIASSADIKRSMTTNANMYLDHHRMYFVCSYLFSVSSVQWQSE